MPTRPKQIDLAQVEQRLAAGESQSAIARSLGVAQSTLSHHLAKAQRAAQSPDPPAGLPQGALGPPHVDQGLPQGPPQGHQSGRPPHVDLSPPQPGQAVTIGLAGRTLSAPDIGGPEDTQGKPQGTPEVHLSGPPLYVHPGIPDSSEESVVGGEDIAEVHSGIPAVPAPGPPQGDQGPPGAGLSPQLVEAVTAAWPDLVQMLTWWRDRHRAVYDAAGPERQLERQTYHIEKRYIEAVRREADLTGESYAAVVNRAFAHYFAGMSTQVAPGGQQQGS